MTKTKSTAADLLLAVDAGGTKTAAWLVDSSGTGSGRILGRGRSTAGNPLSVGFAESTRAITEAVADARHDAQQPDARIGRIILSIAGAANDDMGKQFVHWARGLGLAERVAIVPDVLPVLAAGTPQFCGIALIAGTGSVAYGRNANGQTALCGGWGYLLGDEGSGYAVGQSALSHALQNLERYALLDPLTVRVVDALGAKTLMELTKAVYTSSDPRATIASLAPIVVDAAERRVTAAEAILDFAGTQLANLVARAADLIDLTDRPFSLAVGGGLLVSSKHVRDQLQSWLQRFHMACDTTVVEEPLVGCVRLAADEFSGTLVTWHPT